MSTQVCKFWAQSGKCFHGDGCHFLHTAPGQAAQSQAPARGGPGGGGGGGSGPPLRPCRNVAAQGFCPNRGQGCPFYHPGDNPSGGGPGGPGGSVGGIGGGGGGGGGGNARGGGGGYSQHQHQQHQQHHQNVDEYGEPLAPSTTIVGAAQQPGRDSRHTQGGFLRGASGERRAMYLPRVAARGSASLYGSRAFESFFMSESLHEELTARIAAVLSTPDPDDERLASHPLPPVLDKYHSLDHRDAPGAVMAPSVLFGVSSAVYKAIGAHDGRAYAVRHMDAVGVPVTPQLVHAAKEAGSAWVRFEHPGLVPLRECFVSKQASAEPSLFFVHDYFPGASTLADVYAPRSPNHATEAVIWSLAVQILGTLRAMHAHGLYSRAIHPSKLLLTSTNRVRLAAGGVADAIMPPHESTQERERRDLYDLGISLLATACKAEPDHVDPPQCLEYVATHLSHELRAFVAGLLTGDNGRCCSAEAACASVPQHVIWAQMDRFGTHADAVEAELVRAVENGRIARLLVKLGVINERGGEANGWAETGDRWVPRDCFFLWIFCGFFFVFFAFVFVASFCEFGLQGASFASLGYKGHLLRVC
jgi:PAB-dependent poly(A)-specific ribonuclease subunit 3